jgi:hypothetical protein
MNVIDACLWRVSVLMGALLVLGACSQHRAFIGSDNAENVNTVPANYKADILGAMHAYLNDPTGIREAAISEPALKTVGGNQYLGGGTTRYVVCVQYNAKKNAREYAGLKTVVAVFLLGHFDHFEEKAREQCADAAYAPFPELEKLPP